MAAIVATEAWRLAERPEAAGVPRVARPSSARGQGSEGATSVDVGWVRRAALAQRAACTLIGRVWHRCSSAEGTASADGAEAMASSSGGPSSDGSSPPSSCRSSSLRAPASASLPTLAAADGSARLAARVQGTAVGDAVLRRRNLGRRPSSDAPAPTQKVERCRGEREKKLLLRLRSSCHNGRD